MAKEQLFTAEQAKLMANNVIMPRLDEIVERIVSDIKERAMRGLSRHSYNWIVLSENNNELWLSLAYAHRRAIIDRIELLGYKCNNVEELIIYW